MKIERVEVRHLALPMKGHFTTSFGRFEDQHFVIVKAWSDGLVGYGEAASHFGPVYSSETPDSIYLALRDHILPCVVGQDFAGPQALLRALDWIRGNQYAKSAIEIALTNLLAQAAGQPLHTWLGGTQPEIRVGVSIGIQDNVDQLLGRIQQYLDEGYVRIKMKIQPGWDVDVVRRVRERYPDITLMVDGNSAYTLADAEHLKQLDAFNLLMIEQPLAWHDVVDHAKLQAGLRTPICLDESIHHVDDARHAIELKSCRIINIKPGRVGGYLNSKKIHDLCQANGIANWIGCNLESGVGQMSKIELAALPNCTLPADMAPSNRYYVEDIVEPAIVLSPRGAIPVSNQVGGSYRPIQQKMEKYTLKKFEA